MRISIFVLANFALGHLAATATFAAPTGGVDIAAMDKAVQPGDDFFRYADGGWLAATG